MNAQPNLKILETHPSAIPVCFAEDSGQICGAPATSFDAHRGCMVCEKHKPAIGLAEQVLGPVDPIETGPQPGAIPSSTGPTRTGQDSDSAGPDSEEETIEFKQGEAKIVIYASGPWRQTDLGAAIMRACEPLAKKLGVEL